MKLYRLLDERSQVTYAVFDGQGYRRVQGDPCHNWQSTQELVKPSRVLPPIAPPQIFAIGLNYRAHAAETNKPLPDAPVVFAKAVTSVIGPDDVIVLPAAGPDCVDYEVELAVIIGRTARNVPAGKALEHVLGYTVANDVSARDWQQRLGQWVRAKSFDTFCPIGPCIETQLDPSDLRLTTSVNGQVMQDSRTSDMVFNVPQLIEFLSADLTLLPGTLILTGTPSGVGVARKPPVFLRAGDKITCSVEGIGELTNMVSAAANASLWEEPKSTWGT